jgi:uncharacterized Fe-S radical SAM superfamily protein PflX
VQNRAWVVVVSQLEQALLKHWALHNDVYCVAFDFIAWWKAEVGLLTVLISLMRRYKSTAALFESRAASEALKERVTCRCKD